MPLYDYACARCGLFEASRKIAERDTPFDCPTCGNAATRGIAGKAASVVSRSSQRDGAGSYGMRHMGGCLCCR